MAIHDLILALHAHLPFIRHPEEADPVEERAFFEAITESYLPLLRVFDHLDADQVPFKLVMSFSPTLCAMLSDELLCDRYVKYLDRLIELGAREVKRTKGDERRHRLACLYYDRAVEDRVAFAERYDRELLKAFDYYHKKGRLELWTSAATHAILPFLAPRPEAVQAQIEIALTMHRQHFGRGPQGFWLPELAWFPGIDDYLKAYNIAYTLVDTHGLLYADPVPSAGIFSPIKTKNGLIVFGRDHNAVSQLMDKQEGFVFDPCFRSECGDIAYELESEALGDFLGPNGERTQSGFKYCGRGQEGEERRLYDPDQANQRVLVLADSFLRARSETASAVEKSLGSRAISFGAFKAELFGQFWYEGPAFLEAVFRQAPAFPELRFALPQDLVEDVKKIQCGEPEFSTWGENGYAEKWLDASNDWLYRHILGSVARMIELAERFPDDGGLKERALNQAVRELLLAQSSDWAAAMKDRQAPEYAKRRLEESVMNFNHIYESLGGNYISTEWLTTLEKRHNLFQGINYRIFRRKK